MARRRRDRQPQPRALHRVRGPNPRNALLDLPFRPILGPGDRCVRLGVLTTAIYGSRMTRLDRKAADRRELRRLKEAAALDRGSATA
jgi:hypothetical protein